MSDQNNKLSLEPYKGTRDFYPEGQFIQNYIFFIWRTVVERFGYEEYNASVLEETALYKAKSGEEIVNEQTYTFTDRGGRDVTIRPEMTPTVARMVAQKRKELAFPLRWFSIPNLFRYERPQRGRLREHWQLNVDMFGVESLEADLELIHIASQIMKTFGAKDDQYTIRINSRKFLNFLFNDFLRLTPDQAYKVSKLMDRMHKISGEEFSAQALEIIGDATLVESFVGITRIKSLEELPREIQGNESVIELQNVLARLKEMGITNSVFEISLVRGFDYYTGLVFEVFDTNPANPRAILGGGRYDDLVGIFDVEKVPGIGFGAGDVTMRDYLETYQLLPEYKPATELYICPMEESYISFANNLASQARFGGINTVVDLTGRKVAAQIKTADRQHVTYIIVVGEDEMKNDSYKLKRMSTGEEKIVTSKDLASTIRGMR